MPRLGQLIETTRRLTVTFAGGELKIQYRPAVITPRFQKAIATAQLEGDLDALVVEPFCRVVVSWDLTGEDGGLIPIEPESVSELPSSLLKDIMTAVAEDMAADPTRGAASGSTSPPMASSAASRNGTSS